MRARLAGGVLTAALAAAVVTGCSSPATPTAGAPGAPPSSAATAPAGVERNDADIAFARSMVPHHVGATEMAKEALLRASAPQVKDLASRIEAAQTPEIEQMQRMLAAWGAPPASTSSGMGDPTSGTSGQMPGMAGPTPGAAMPGMDPAQMQQLASSSGPAFDRQFLTMMIEHHRSAIEMARTELARGQNPEATQLAQRIITGQQQEITEMQGLLSGS